MLSIDREMDMQHFKTIAPITEFDSDGLCEEDRFFQAMDEAEELNAGKLVNGICVCGRNWSHVIGKRWCDFCQGGSY
jgi:hypothetical protein